MGKARFNELFGNQDYDSFVIIIHDYGETILGHMIALGGFCRVCAIILQRLDALDFQPESDYRHLLGNIQQLKILSSRLVENTRKFMYPLPDNNRERWRPYNRAVFENFIVQLSKQSTSILIEIKQQFSAFNDLGDYLRENYDAELVEKLLEVCNKLVEIFIQIEHLLNLTHYEDAWLKSKPN